MSPEAQQRKLIDEFLDMVNARGLSVAGKIEEADSFGDLVCRLLVVTLSM
jgi:hypothetical protein